MVIRIFTATEIKREAERLLSQNSEDEVFEVKEKRNGFDKNELGQYFSALSNEAALRNIDNAWIIFGIDNAMKPVGTTVLPSKESRIALKKDIADLTTNRITFVEIYETELNGKRILMFQIPSVPNIVMMFNGIAYGRDGESLVGLNLEKINRLQFRNYDWSNELVDHGVEDLDEEAITYAKNNYVAKNPHTMMEVQGWSTEEFMSRFGLVRNGRITKAAMILFGNRERIPESEFNVTISWILKDRKRDVLDYEHFTMPLLLSAEKVLRKITNLTFRRVLDGLNSEDFPTYDPMALREAINNSIAHSDYRIRSNINVIELQNDSVLFCNPGSFLPGSIEKLLLSDNSSSIYRNKLISETMYRLGLVDSVGMGIKRIFNSQINRAFPLPDYTFDEFGICLKMTGHPLNDSVTRIMHFNEDLTLEELLSLDHYQKGKKLTDADILNLGRIRKNCRYGDELNVDPEGTGESMTFSKSEKTMAVSKIQENILVYLASHKDAPVQKLSEDLGIPQRTARYNISKLVENGKLIKNGRGRSVSWTVND